MLEKEAYLKTVRRPYPLLFNYIMCQGFPQKASYEAFLLESFAITDIVRVDDIWYYGKALLELGGRLTLEAWSDTGRLEKARQEFSRREKMLLDASQKSFTEFCEAYENFMPAIILVYVLEKPLEETLETSLLQMLSVAEVKRMMHELNAPLEDNTYKREEYDLVMTDDIVGHVKKYRSVYTRYGEESEYTVEEAQKKLAAIDKESFLQNRKGEKQKLEETIRSVKEILGEKAYFVDLLQFIVFYRTERTDILNQSLFQALPMFKEMARSLGLSYQQLLACTSEEILKRKVLNVELLEEREKNYAIMLDAGELKLVYGREAEKIKEYLADEITDLYCVKGTVAARGKVTGIVKKVFVKTDYEKVKDGDVLVTSMTSPDMVPIMKKAAAFITDEGGITCHAAIIAREMKKPCIIGTRIATQVLKDGDMVEVDADQGVVRILNK